MRELFSVTLRCWAHALGQGDGPDISAVPPSRLAKARALDDGQDTVIL
jgi:hypothetical protein